jgi:alcohol dehydrogenase class IV
MMNPFVFHSPTRIIFGEYAASSVVDAVREVGGTKVLFVTDDFLLKSKILDPVLASLAELGAGCTIVFSDVPPDSEIKTVNSAAKIAVDSGCDCVVAVGGGSVLDTAKVANICISMGGHLMEYQGLNNLADRLKPLIAIPTTAGTGSEVSMVAMVKDSAESKKLMFGSRFLAPDVAILDPTLIISLPPRLTAATGMDAITHAIESYSSVISSSSFTEALCLQALRFLFDNLERATVDGTDIDARSATLIASTMAGVAFTNSGVGIIHALSHAVGARYNTHHGATNSIFLPHGMDFNKEVAAPRYADMARFLKLDNSGDDEKAAQSLIDAVRQLTQRLKLPLRLRDMGVTDFEGEQLNELAELAATDASIMFNPREVSNEDLIDIFKRAY